jgi:hypothetical protein
MIHPGACNCIDCVRNRGISLSPTALHPTTVAAELLARTPQATIATPPDSTDTWCDEHQTYRWKCSHSGGFEAPQVTYLGNVASLLSTTCGHGEKN